MNDNDNNVYEILAKNLPLLQEKLDEMNRRAAKLGCEPIALQIVGEFEIEVKNPDTGVKYKVRKLKVQVDGNTPKLNGWRLLAAIEKLETGENLLRCVPGCTVPESYRFTDTHCDHCHSDRRRKEVFVLQHDDGRYVQVGRQCIADFLGHQSVENICGRAAWDFALADELRDAEDEGYGSRGELLVSLEEFVTTVAIVVRRLGWLSRTKAQELGEFGPQSTANIAWQCCTDSGEYTKKLIKSENLYAEDRDVELAEKAIAWAKTLPTENVADYIYNLGVSIRREFVTWKTTGVTASVIAAYQREHERVEEFKRQAKISAHVGTVGERQGFAGVVVKSMKYFESEYGTKTLVRFEDQSGNTLIWWATANTDWLKEGETLDITGTVKKHGDYKGFLQTELSRVAEGLPKAKKSRKKAAAAAAAVETKECPF